MTDPSAFINPLRREEETALHVELINRLHQRGLRVNDAAPADALADLLSALDVFEAAVQHAGGDLFVNAPDSSEPERSEFVVPHMLDDETVTHYTKRILTAATQVRHLER
ncbi:MAG TPA: hypothetical protein VNU46_02640 [Gemmatimonadaceae bacterium]|jgi:hypothetical protein|nr:hypothetical protein [Gemmatimonadaceae bacterium]